eukprot:scaffold3972_cov298-Alexandrium_tamarense.AAC.2
MARHLFRSDILFRSNQATAISFDKYISLKQKVWNANDRNTAPLSRRSDYQPNGADWSTKTRIGSPQRQRLTELPPICKCSPSQPALHPRRLQFI